MDILIAIAVAVAFGGLLLAGAGAVYSIVQKLKAGPDGVVGTADDVPAISSVESAVAPYVYSAILAGEKLAFQGLDQLKLQLASEDKKAIADSFYNLLPDVIYIAGQAVPLTLVRRILPVEDFERMVKEAYDRADALIQRNETYLKSQTDKFKVLVGG